MIVGRELRTWVENREGQRLTRLAAQALSDGWAEGPVHLAFARATAAIPARTAEAVGEAMRALFADDGWVDHLIDTLAEEMRRNPYFDPPFRHLNSALHGGLVVYEDDLVSVAAGVCNVTQLAARKCAPRTGGSISFSGQLSIIKFVKAGGARLSFWEAPRIAQDFSAAHAGRCERIAERSIADGEILTVDGRHQSYIIEHAAANMVIVQAEVKADHAPVSVEYDAASGDYVACSAADDSASRIQMITTLLRLLGRDGAFGAIADFLQHPSFFVRWHVMRDLLGIDLEAALPHLKRMAARDPHPEIRQAARATLDHIESGTIRDRAACWLGSFPVPMKGRSSWATSSRRSTTTLSTRATRRASPLRRPCSGSSPIIANSSPSSPSRS